MSFGDKNENLKGFIMQSGLKISSKFCFNIGQKCILYRAKIHFILSKNSFYTEQKSISYRAFNSHPFKKCLVCGGILYQQTKVVCAC
jgi:hypothetical protein